MYTLHCAVHLMLLRRACAWACSLQLPSVVYGCSCSPSPAWPFDLPCTDPLEELVVVAAPMASTPLMCHF